MRCITSTKSVLNDILPQSFATVKEKLLNVLYIIKLKLLLPLSTVKFLQRKEYVELEGVRPLFGVIPDAAGKPIT
jgi:hypothetical protein